VKRKTLSRHPNPVEKLELMIGGRGYFDLKPPFSLQTMHYCALALNFLLKSLDPDKNSVMEKIVFSKFYQK